MIKNLLLILILTSSVANETTLCYEFPEWEEPVELDVVATAYNSLSAQTDDSPFITATMDSVFWGGVAVSRPLLADSLFPYGSIIVIEGYPHPFIVFDTMNKRFKNYKVDIWFESYKEALSFGVQKIKITKIGKIRKDQISEFPTQLALLN